MAQHDYDIANQNGPSLRQDLNGVFEAVMSNNSGTTSPSVTAPHMWWADTTAGIIKQRNAADTAWINRFAFDATLLSAGNNLSELTDKPAAFAAIKQPASTTTTGVIEKATPTETANGTADKYPDAELIKAAYLQNTIISQALAEGGSDTDPYAWSSERVRQAVLSVRNISPAYTITSGGLITWAHGLGAIPYDISLHLKCLTAEHGYAGDDLIKISLNTSTDAVTKINSVKFDDTNVYIRLATGSNSFIAANFSTGGSVNLTNSSWELYIRAEL